MNKMKQAQVTDVKKAMKQLLMYCKPYLVAIVIALILAIASSIFSIIGPSQLSKITDEITNGLVSGIRLDFILQICIVLLIIYVCSAVCSYTQGFIMATVTNKFSKRLRTEISQKINKLSLNYFDTNSYGDVLSRVTNDVDTIAQTMNQSVGNLVSAITLFIGCILMMFIMNWMMAMTAIIATAIGFMFMMVILSKSQKYFAMQQKELGELNGHIEEIYAGHTVVKVYNGVEEAKHKFQEINDKLCISVQKSQFLSGLNQPIMSFIGNFGYVAVCIVGALLTLHGSITFGVIVAFMVYIRLFTNPLTQIAQAMTQLQSTLAASERVFAFIEEEEMEDESYKTKYLNKHEVCGKIEFQHVKFSYTEEKEIIKDFNCYVEAGQKVAIVGPTGAGKTTMVNLLMRFYDIKEGTIRIDGVSINDLTRENIHDLFVMVLQDTWIFSGTIKENIAYNDSNITDEEIINACKVVGLDHFIKTLPQGYDTVLHDMDMLSAGEKQLLTIARAMVKKAPFLILDEATSSVDTRTEALVQKAMDTLMKGRTSFIIAHRLSTIKNADMILVMKEGNIIEQGTHQELLMKKGFYAELYNSQFEKVA